MTFYIDHSGLATNYLPALLTQPDFEQAAEYVSQPDLFPYAYASEDVTLGKDEEEDGFSERLDLEFTRTSGIDDKDEFYVSGTVTTLTSALDLCAKLLRAAGFSVNRLEAEVGPKSDGEYVYHSSTV
jgi:hypothetical protein